MSIRPVDFGGMMQQTSEIGALKANDDSKVNINQQNIAVDVDEEIEEQARQVNEQENAEGGNTEYDAREEGRNKYSKNNTKAKKKKDAPKDKVTIKSAHSSFDITI